MGMNIFESVWSVWSLWKPVLELKKRCLWQKLMRDQEKNESFNTKEELL